MSSWRESVCIDCQTASRTRDQPDVSGRSPQIGCRAGLYAPHPFSHVVRRTERMPWRARMRGTSYKTTFVLVSLCAAACGRRPSVTELAATGSLDRACQVVVAADAGNDEAITTLQQDVRQHRTPRAPRSVSDTTSCREPACPTTRAITRSQDRRPPASRRSARTNLPRAAARTRPASDAPVQRSRSDRPSPGGHARVRSGLRSSGGRTDGTGAARPRRPTRIRR